jgi:hypothetical protein
MNYIFSCIQAYNSCLDCQIYMPIENKLFQIRQIYVVYRLCEIFFQKINYINVSWIRNKTKVKYVSIWTCILN